MDKHKKISALIITYNEEKQIDAVLKEVSFADEIIVIDSFSTDKTAEIATKNPKVKFIQNKFENFTSQRNFAIDQAQYSWILFLDADERFTPALKKEVLETVNASETASAYLFKRIFMFQNKKINFSGTQSDKNYRLFKKEDCRYVSERLVHEKLQVNGVEAVLKNKLIHFSYNSYEDYKKKMVSYGKLKAKEKFAQGMKPSFVRSCLHPMFNFLRDYLLRLGILDGKEGMILCYLNAYEVKIRYQELKRLSSN